MMSSNLHRNRPGSEAVIGNFVTPYPLRLRSRDDDTLEAAVHACHERILVHREHVHVAPRTALGAWTEWSRYNLNYLVDVVDDDVVDFGGVQVERLAWRPFAARTTHDLALFVHQSATGLRGNLMFDAERFSPELVRRAATRLEQLVDRIATAPSDRVCDLPGAP